MGSEDSVFGAAWKSERFYLFPQMRDSVDC